MHVTTILDPTGIPSVESTALATRPQTLRGLRLGCLHNSKPGGEILLRRTAEILNEKFGLREVVWKQKQLPTTPAPFLRQLATECDVVIAALAN